MLKEFRKYLTPDLIKYFKNGDLRQRQEVKKIVYKNRLLNDKQKDIIYEEIIRIAYN